MVPQNRTLGEDKNSKFQNSVSMESILLSHLYKVKKLSNHCKLGTIHMDVIVNKTHFPDLERSTYWILSGDPVHQSCRQSLKQPGQVSQCWRHSLRSERTLSQSQDHLQPWASHKNSLSIFICKMGISWILTALGGVLLFWKMPSLLFWKMTTYMNVSYHHHHYHCEHDNHM